MTLNKAPKVFSNSIIDRLGNRLKSRLSEVDLVMLDNYRQCFRLDFELAVKAINDKLDIDITGRPTKSTASIIDKLQRESIRLSQMQDIAGCRMIVKDLHAQNLFSAQIASLFSSTTIDRRKQTSHGYRAIHVILKPTDYFVEIQIRTQLQHAWSELSEKLSDSFGIEVKYGGGTKIVHDALNVASIAVARFEELEYKINVFRNEPNSECIIQKLISTNLEISGLEKSTSIDETIGILRQDLVSQMKEMSDLFTNNATFFNQKNRRV